MIVNIHALCNFTTSAAALILLLMWNLQSAHAQTESGWRVLASSGEVQIRAENAVTWSAVKTQHDLQRKATLRTGKNSHARLQNAAGKTFLLPEEAQIEIHELDEYRRTEIVLALTALDLQRLPLRKDSIKTSKSAFILHGAVSDNTDLQTNGELYIRLEENGTLALFEQGFLGGFILKWNRLLQLFPRASSENAEAALIKAYTTLGMPLRAQQARERFQRKWPHAILPE
ncbi:hypothetical protein HUU05_28160 [candidate division KSB1 bacterium]|nr:hypothetical protein [candidate division KSB1 bacterium]